MSGQTAQMGQPGAAANPEVAGGDARDPSMAEILASIQRILSENEPEERPRPPAEAITDAMPEPSAVPAEATLTADPPADEASNDDVLVLEKSMMVSEGVAVAEPAYKSPLLEAAISRDPAPMPEPIATGAPMPHPFPMPEEEADEPPDLHAQIVEPAPPPVAPEPVAVPVSVSPAPASAGLVGAATAAVTASAIGNLVRTIAAERVVPVQRGGLTIEDLVREELRPLLKSWLDTHLPPLVEKLVQVEIERVVNRATS